MGGNFLCIWVQIIKFQYIWFSLLSGSNLNFATFFNRIVTMCSAWYGGYDHLKVINIVGRKFHFVSISKWTSWPSLGTPVNSARSVILLCTPIIAGPQAPLSHKANVWSFLRKLCTFFWKSVLVRLYINWWCPLTGYHYNSGFNCIFYNFKFIVRFTNVKKIIHLLRCLYMLQFCFGQPVLKVILLTSIFSAFFVQEPFQSLLLMIPEWLS